MLRSSEKNIKFKFIKGEKIGRFRIILINMIRFKVLPSILVLRIWNTLYKIKKII